MADTLPEGTDHIVPGAASTTTAERAAANDGAATREKLKSGAVDFRDKISGQASEYFAQASDKARDYAAQGKDRASGALDDVATLLHDNARQIDDKIGSQYGDYARRAAEGVTAAADHLRGKDIEDLMEDARTVIRQSPALALGAAAAAGFFLARVLKSGSDTLAETARAVEPKATTVKTTAAKPRKSGAAKPATED